MPACIVRYEIHQVSLIAIILPSPWIGVQNQIPCSVFNFNAAYIIHINQAACTGVGIGGSCPT